MGDLILTNEAGIHNEARTASSINGAGKTEQLCAKVFKFNQVPLIYFYFCNCKRWVIEDLALIYVIECSAYVFL